MKSTREQLTSAQVQKTHCLNGGERQGHQAVKNLEHAAKDASQEQLLFTGEPGSGDA